MRPKNPVPSYLRHKATGQARVVIGGKTYYLGPYGSEESRAEYGRLLAEWSATRHHPPCSSAGGSSAGPEFRGSSASSTTNRPGLYVSELILAYVRHAEAYYVKDGGQTSEVHVIQAAMRPVKRLYGHTLAKDFGPVALAACRQSLIDQRKTRKHIGDKPAEEVRALEEHHQQAGGRDPPHVSLGASQELIPGSIPQALAALPGLQGTVRGEGNGQGSSRPG